MKNHGVAMSGDFIIEFMDALPPYDFSYEGMLIYLTDGTVWIGTPYGWKDISASGDGVANIIDASGEIVCDVASYRSFVISVSGPVTISFTGFSTDKSVSVELTIINGIGNVTFTDVVWSEGETPELTSGKDLLQIISEGDDIHGMVCGYDHLEYIDASPFVSVWRTTLANENVILPTNSPDNDFTIDWGDGVVEDITSANPSHTYAVADDHLVRITGVCPSLDGWSTSDTKKLVSVFNMGNCGWLSLKNAFNCMYGGSILESFAFGKGDTSSVTDMSSMFNGCGLLVSVDLLGIDTLSVTDMSSMFNGCGSLASVDFTGFVASSVTTMRAMFDGCSSLTSVDFTGIVASSVTDINYMFDGCSSLVSMDLTGFITPSALTTEYMFRGCTALQTINMLSVDFSSVMDMYGMFNGCTALTSIDLSNINLSSVWTVRSMFSGCTSLQTANLTNTNFSSLDTTDSMFLNCSSLISVYFTNTVFSVLRLMVFMFQNCTSLTSLDFSTVDLSTVEDFSTFADGCLLLTSVDIGGNDITSATNMSYMFGRGASGCTLDLVNYNSILLGWSSQSVQSNVVFDAGNSKYSDQTSRDILTGTYGWTIIDGGLA